MKFRTLLFLTAVVVILQLILSVYVGVATRDTKIGGQLIGFCLKADAILVVLYGAFDTFLQYVK